MNGAERYQSQSDNSVTLSKMFSFSLKATVGKRGSHSPVLKVPSLLSLSVKPSRCRSRVRFCLPNCSWKRAKSPALLQRSLRLGWKLCCKRPRFLTEKRRCGDMTNLLRFEILGQCSRPLQSFHPLRTRALSRGKETIVMEQRLFVVWRIPIVRLPV
jgi:hypothetical protein